MTRADTSRAGERVEIDRVSLRYGPVLAVEDATVAIEPGEFFSFLGPSGCGKTTLLRIMSGFIEPTSGTVRIGGRDMLGIGPSGRPTVLIFQSLALFPFMTVAENIGFGLEMRGVNRSARRKRTAELLELIALPDAADKRISELSGGQRQRVAIARALAVEPKVMLLDEPLSALDLKLRQHMRAELRSLQKRTGVTFIYITHDQGEALAMSDRMAVMSRGRIQQVATPGVLYDAPANGFVATFIGEINAFPGRVTGRTDGQAMLDTSIGPMRGTDRHGLRQGDEAVLFVRPERMRIAAADDLRADNLISTHVNNISFEGSFTHILLDGGPDRGIVMQFANDGARHPVAPGLELHVAFDAADALVLPTGELASDT